jgi:C4-dicarboxylate-specific signal transduction histidine kinase
MSKILIVDDDAVSRRLLSMILTKADKGYIVIEADSGESALEQVAKEPPDIILLDVMMPKMDGFEVCKKLKADERSASIPVLFLTGLDKTEDIVKGFRFGSSDYITKPVNADEVKARVAVHLALKKAEEERVEMDHLRILKGTVAALNHNMNQPLMATYTYINTAMEKLSEKDESRKTYMRLKGELDKLNSILRKIQALTAVKSSEYVGKTEIIDLDYRKDGVEQFQVMPGQIAKMAALGEFAASVAHSLNQPLSAIAARIESLLMDTDVTSHPVIKDRIEEMKREFSRFGSMVNMIGGYSKMRQPEMRKGNINIPVLDSLQLFEQQLKDDNIALAPELGEEIPDIYFDRYQIEDAMINLLVNARDAINELYQKKVGGKVRVFSGVIRNERAVIVGLIDNGSPITEEAERKLFTPFFTTKGPEKGTGLGLAVCGDIIKKHRGSIGFIKLKDDKKGFYFALPMDKDRDMSEGAERIRAGVIALSANK